MVVLISSALKNTQNRAAIRETWGKQWNCVKVAYLVGTTEDPELIQMIQEENDEHRDVIQGNFVDSYRNLTYKHVMALKWVAYYCPKAKYVVKTDDDLVVNTTRLYEVLKAKTFGERNLIACGVRHLGPVMRKKDLKWFVTREEYHEDYYPDYCTGAFIIYSADVARRLLAASRKVRPFWIDDVYVSGILAKVIGVTHVQIKTDEWYTRKTEMMKAGLKQLNNKIYGPLSLKPEKIREIWKTKLDGGNEISWDMHEILIEYLMSSERTYMS
ncbi:galactosyltransferase domain-containing protein [Phthorimaea operculella]|nr:galactosyltransferase domain-containing protein [Phthorimaea operculella]